MKVQPVILCGGSGPRLWPLSRAGFPKQFPMLAGNESLFQQAVQRLARLAADDLALAPSSLATKSIASRCWTHLREIKLKPSALLR